jgi:TorA maturation chaperone TorD
MHRLHKKIKVSLLSWCYKALEKIKSREGC